MSKSKPSGKKITQQKSTEKLIKERARNIQLDKCYINSEWVKWKICHIIVSRKHINGNLTFALFSVDLALYGVKNVLYKFNAFPDEMEEIITIEELEFEEISYELAHNIVYAGIEWADDFGFKPHKNWQTAKYILEDDNDNIPLIEIECGIDGLPAIFKNSAISYRSDLQKLAENAGSGNYLFFEDIDDYDDFEGESNYLDEEFVESVVNEDIDELMPEFWDDDYEISSKEFENNEIGQLALLNKFHYEKFGKLYLDNIDLIDFAIGDIEIISLFDEYHESETLLLNNDSKQEEFSFEEISIAFEKFPDSSYLFNLLYNCGIDNVSDSDDIFFAISEKIYQRFNCNLFAIGNYLCHLAMMGQYDKFEQILGETDFMKKVLKYEAGIPWMLFVYYCACCSFISLHENKFEQADKYYYALRAFTGLLDNPVIVVLAINIGNWKIAQLEIETE